MIDFIEITKAKLMKNGKMYIEISTGEGGEFDKQEYDNAPDKLKFFKDNF